MSPRLAVGGLVHETNSFATGVSGATTMDRFTLVEPDQLVERVSETPGYLGGMVAAAGELGLDVVGLFYADARPSGLIDAETYARLRERLVQSVRDQLPLDAVCLSLHGAGAAEGVDDVEGDLAVALRKEVGPDVPLLCTLDLHGNISDRMGEEFDAMLGVQLYPHTDTWDRGHELVSLVPSLLDGTRLTTHVEHLPMLLPGSTTDAGSIAARMNEECARVEAWPGVVDCTVFHGFPFTDSPEVGVHVVCITEGDAELARRGARDVGSWIWGHRDDFAPDTVSPTEALRIAADTRDIPVVINDTADNPGGGAPGDGTHLLRALLTSEIRPACFGLISDPDVVRAAQDAGVGATIAVQLGGHHGDLHGAPIEAQAEVVALTDGRITLGPIAPGAVIEVGATARLDIAGVAVVVSSRPFQVYDPEVFTLHGIDVLEQRVVALKSTHHFRAGFRDVAARIVTADSPGLTTQRVELLPRATGLPPMWPVDPEATWP